MRELTQKEGELKEHYNGFNNQYQRLVSKNKNNNCNIRGLLTRRVNFRGRVFYDVLKAYITEILKTD